MRIDWKLLFALVTIGSMLLVACAAPATPTAAPAKPPAAAATTAPAVAAPTAAAAVATKPAAPAAAASPASTAPAAAKATEKPKRGGIVKLAVGSEMTPNLDPHQNTNHPWGYEAIYGSYIQYVLNLDTKKWELKPYMVEQWSSPDPKTVVFKLRKGVSFHDGSPWNAISAKWNLDRHRGVDFKKSSYKAELEPIDSIDIVDDYTIKMNLKSPSAALVPMLSDGSYRSHLMSMESTKKNGDAWVENNMVGAGPMKFVEWKRDDRIVATKWDKYWENGDDGQPLPYLDGMELIQAKDQTTKALNMRVGMFHACDGIQAKDQLTLEKDPNLTLIATGIGSEYYFFVNMKEPVWGKNQKLRQAVSYALDRDNIAKAAGLGTGLPAYYHWAPGMLGYNEAVPKFSYDVAKAKSLLKEAGFESGTKVDLSSQSDESSTRVAQILKQMWDAAGIQTTISSYDRTAVQDKWLAADYQIGVSSKTFGEVDADIVSWRFTTGGSKNFAASSNKAVDDCMKEGRETQDFAQRQKVYEKCQGLIFDEAAYGTLYSYPNTGVFSKKLKGYTNELSMNAPRITRAWLDQ
jgi:peptide/nickel transport system substrate-binding protein